jgi:predicted component of type VI protein secretion system
MKVTLIKPDKSALPVPDKPRVTFGRAVDCDIPLSKTNTAISRKHFTLTQKDGKLFITDTSSNGTEVNLTKIDKDKPFEIFNGDKITVGDLNLTVKIEGAAKKTEKKAEPKTDTAKGPEEVKLTIAKEEPEITIEDGDKSDGSGEFQIPADEFFEDPRKEKGAEIPDDLIAEVQASVGAKPTDKKKVPATPPPTPPKSEDESKNPPSNPPSSQKTETRWQRFCNWFKFSSGKKKAETKKKPQPAIQSRR